MMDFQKIYEFQQKGDFTNCEIKIGEDSFRVHCNIMFPPSDYLTAFGSKFEAGKDMFIDLTGLIDAKIFDKIIRYIYISEIELNEDNFAQISQAADLLQIKELKKKCSRYIPGIVCDELPESPEDLKPSHKIYECQQEGVVRDCTVTIGKNSFEVHSAMLTAASGYFKHYAGKLGAGKSMSVDITDLVDSKTFEKICNYIYTDEIEINDGNYIRISDAADLLQIEKLEAKCSDYKSSSARDKLPKSLEDLKLSHQQVKIKGEQA